MVRAWSRKAEKHTICCESEIEEISIQIEGKRLFDRGKQGKSGVKY